MRTRWGLALAMVLGAVVALAATTAWANHDIDSATYSGCLNTKSGTLSKLQLGFGTAGACTAQEVEIRLGAGDISAVFTPHDGALEGGAVEGSASLDLQDGYKLPQGCTNGQVATADGSGVWICATPETASYSGADFAVSDQGCPTGEFVTGIDGTGNVTCGTVALSAGDYAVNITETGLALTGPGGSVSITSSGVSIEGTTALTLSGGATVSVQGAGTVALQGGVVTLNGSGCGVARTGDTVEGIAIVSPLSGSGTMYGSITSASPTVLTGC